MICQAQGATAARQAVRIAEMRARIARAVFLLGVVAGLPAAGLADQSREPTLAHMPLVSEHNHAALRSQTERYRRIEASGGWPGIDNGPPLRAGDIDERTTQLRKRLEIEGFLGTGYGSSQFDAAVENALKAFQEHHGLRASGVLNGATRRALNVPAAERLAQLTYSVDRIAELLSHARGGHYVLVNIPSFELQVIARDRVLLYSRVIVGKTATPTPTLHASIRAVDLLPYWHVPPSIAQRAIIPAIRKDPSYLARERIRVFSAWGGAEIDPSTVNWYAPQATRYVFRQDPGPQNALGLVRIDMPNRFTVYMHDTPMKRLFNSRNRPYSAGCVRVQSILALAGLLLGEDEPSIQRRLEPLLASGTRASFKVAEPVPVLFTYLTAWPDVRGRLEFRNDLYTLDDQATDEVATSETDPWHTRVIHISP